MTASLLSWGRYPRIPQQSFPAHWRSELREDLFHLAKTFGDTLPFGNGRSYGDSCLANSGQVMYMRPLNRFISVDWQRGIIAAEAGMTLEEILALALPKGWFLPVTPGTKYVTLGGAIANDVHGKNHHVRGTFGCYVRRFALMRSDQPPMTCSMDENAELFCATIGGLGLTGIIEWAELQLIPVQSAMIDTTTTRFSSLGGFFDLCKKYDELHEYTVAWVDCLARGTSLGRGIFYTGDHARTGGLKTDPQRKLFIPFTPPLSTINPVSLRLFNAFYYRRHKTERNQNQVSYEPFFYPLDSILQWNRIYGPKGFQQFQCIIPFHNAEEAIKEILGVTAAAGEGSFLAVLKQCGSMNSPGWLSFPMPGVSLALDFRQRDHLNCTLFPHLDTIVRQSGGRLYPAKDAHMSGEDFRNFYPKWQQLESLRDPALCSRFWSRVNSS